MPTSESVTILRCLSSISGGLGLRTLPLGRPPLGRGGLEASSKPRRSSLIVHWLTPNCSAIICIVKPCAYIRSASGLRCAFRSLDDSAVQAVSGQFCGPHSGMTMNKGRVPSPWPWLLYRVRGRRCQTLGLLVALRAAHAEPAQSDLHGKLDGVQVLVHDLCLLFLFGDVTDDQCGHDVVLFK